MRLASMPARQPKLEPTAAPRTRVASTELRSVWSSTDGQSQLFQGEHLALFERLADASVDCIWTDPPYFLSNGGTTCHAGRRTRVDKGAWDHSRGLVADHAFNRTWLAQCQRVLKPGGTIWVSGTHHVYLSVGMGLLELGFRLLNDIVWEKPNPPPNLGCRCFTHATEMLLWAANNTGSKSARHTRNYSAMKAENGGRQMKNVWRFTAPGREEKSAGKHPTQKPLQLIERCLRASTLPGDLVLDPFVGSGSTGVAAIACGRHFIGVDIEPVYTKVARRRLLAVAPKERSA